MANLLFTLAPGRFVTAWVLDLLKKRADLQAKKSPIYPANFDTFYGLLGRKFPEIPVQNSMDRFGPTGKVSKKQVHLNF